MRIGEKVSHTCVPVGETKNKAGTGLALDEGSGGLATDSTIKATCVPSLSPNLAFTRVKRSQATPRLFLRVLILSRTR